MTDDEYERSRLTPAQLYDQSIINYYDQILCITKRRHADLYVYYGVSILIGTVDNDDGTTKDIHRDIKRCCTFDMDWDWEEQRLSLEAQSVKESGQFISWYSDEELLNG